MVNGCAAEVLKHRRTDEQMRRLALAQGIRLRPGDFKPAKNKKYPYFTPARNKDVFNQGRPANQHRPVEGSVAVFIRKYHRRNDIQPSIQDTKWTMYLDDELNVIKRPIDPWESLPSSPTSSLSSTMSPRSRNAFRSMTTNNSKGENERKDSDISKSSEVSRGSPLTVSASNSLKKGTQNLSEQQALLSPAVTSTGTAVTPYQPRRATVMRRTNCRHAAVLESQITTAAKTEQLTSRVTAVDKVLNDRICPKQELDRSSPIIPTTSNQSLFAKLVSLLTFSKSRLYLQQHSQSSSPSCQKKEFSDVIVCEDHEKAKLTNKCLTIENNV